MNTFYIVRHGETQWNIQGKTQGHGDSNLTEKGIDQARRLAKHLDKYPIDYIYSSDLGRATQTAKIIGSEFNKDVVYTEELREMSFGKWEGLTIQEIQQGYGDVYKTWRNEPHKAEIPNGEKLELLKERLLNCIEDINKKHKNSHIVLVSHSMSVRIMILSLIGSDLSNIYRIKQDNTALNIVEIRDYGPVVVKINDTSHLDGINTVSNSALE